MCLTTKKRKQIRVAQTNRSAFSPIPMSLEISYGWHCFTRPVMSGFITLQFLGFSLLFVRWLLLHLVLYTSLPGTSLVVQWLRPCASTAGGTGLIPGQGTKIPHAKQQGLLGSLPSSCFPPQAGKGLPDFMYIMNSFKLIF